VDSHLPHIPCNLKVKLWLLHQLPLCTNCLGFRVSLRRLLVL
jgi:hypothetical protein